MEGWQVSENDERQGNQSHGFLGVIGTMAQREGDGGEDLHPVEKVFGAGGGIAGEMQCHPKCQRTEEESKEGRGDEYGHNIEEAPPDDMTRPLSDQNSSNHPSD
jgi:hypothetical protein